jgi:choline dehydrogenase-like flavoprotein
MPPFRNVRSQDPDADFQGKYLVTVGAARSGWQRGAYSGQIGSELKKEMMQPGGWGVNLGIQGETVPRYENHVRLSETETDAWGIPQLVTSIDYTENDEKLLQDFLDQASEMLERAGAKNIEQNDTKQAPGLDIHEVGGARMGSDPSDSILNRWNQVHACQNVFVTDGACMSSVSVQNPSLTFMALTARAANYAADEMEKGNL